jgi:DNA-directed RNA polymerase specialized sigma24 family protein
MAKKTKNVVEVEDVEVEDLEDLVEDEDLDSDTDDAETDEVEETPEGIRPKDLAKELGISPKSLRAYLRRAFPRTSEAKNTSWYLNDDQVAAARKNFELTDEDDESNEDDAE